MKRGQDTLMPNWALEALECFATPHEIKSLIYLVRHRHSTGNVFSAKQLAIALEIPVIRVQKSLDMLMTGGFILGHDGEYCSVEAASPVNYAVVSRSIPTAVRREVFQLNENACAYCGSTENLSLDHLIPWSRGGLHEVSNLVIACKSCNSSKNAKTPEEWLGRVMN